MNFSINFKSWDVMMIFYPFGGVCTLGLSKNLISPEHLKVSVVTSSRHVNISFTVEKQKDNRMFFLDVNIIGEQEEFTTSVYRKSTFSGICIHFDGFLPSAYKIGMIHTLFYICFWICSYWTKFHLELVKLMNVLLSWLSCAENFIDNYFKTFLDNKHRIKEKTITVPKKFSPFAYPRTVSLQTRAIFKKFLRYSSLLENTDFLIVFKSQKILPKAFCFKDPTEHS